MSKESTNKNDDIILGYEWMNSIDDFSGAPLLWARGEAEINGDEIGIKPREFYAVDGNEFLLLIDVSDLATVFLSEKVSRARKEEELHRFTDRHGLLLYGWREDRIHAKDWKMTWTQWEENLAEIQSCLVVYARLKECLDGNAKFVNWWKEEIRKSFSRTDTLNKIDITNTMALHHASNVLGAALSAHLSECPVQVISHSLMKKVGVLQRAEPTRLSFGICVRSLIHVIYRFIATIAVESKPILICVNCGRLFEARSKTATCRDACRKELSRSIPET